MRGLLARLVGGSDRTRAEPELLAAQEAGIGMSVSYDGGLTWVGGFVPGLPFDTSPASLASPAYRAGMQGMSDPVVVAAPCGRFYLAHLAFTRNQSSQLLVSVLQDQNNDDLRHTIRWVKSTLIEQGNNASFGHFLDKPHIAVAPTGAVSCGAVTEKVYVSYTTFTGNGSGGKFQSKINLATSVDGGGTFTVSKVDDSYTQSQGTAVVANPATGDVHVFWRSFNAPNSVIMSKTGRNGWTKPLDILGAEPLKTIATFDQPSVTTQDVAGNPGLLAFRTNGFPAAAVTPDGGTLLVAWQERVNASGLPDPAGAPKIVLKYSKDGGATWTPRRAIAFDHPASPPGLGFFNPGFPVGPQVMPSLSCGPGSPNRCLLTYYESRPYGSSALSANGWMGGYDRVLDLRAQLIDAPKIGAPAFNPSFQVSRYSYRPLANGELPGEDASVRVADLPSRRPGLLSEPELQRLPAHRGRHDAVHGGLQRRPAGGSVRQGCRDRSVACRLDGRRRAVRRGIRRGLGRQPERGPAGPGGRRRVVAVRELRPGGHGRQLREPGVA